MKKRITAVLLAGMLLAGCGGQSEEDTKKAEDLKARVTSVDTELATMYGKLEDMHETGLIDDDFYDRFMAIDSAADECMEYAEKSNFSVEKLEEMVKKLEDDFASCKAGLDEVNSRNEENLMQDLIVLQFAVKEQESLMKRALDAGRVTQDDLDEFAALKKKVDVYNTRTDLKYDDKFKEEIAELRSSLTALASKAGADNALIDRLMGTDLGGSADEKTQAQTENADSTDIKTTEKSEIEPETEALSEQAANGTDKTQKAEIPENIKKLIDDYMALQEFASQKQAAGEIDDVIYIELLSTGVELSYLKEAVQKDGVTENNTYTMQDIKAALYEKAQSIGYDKAEVFK